MNFFQHETAVIDPTAMIGAGSMIWHFSHVCEGARIGRNVILGQNSYVGPSVVIGDDCKIQNNVSIYEGVTLGAGVFCGPSVVFTNVLMPRAVVNQKDNFQKTIVHEGASIGANATVVCGNELGRYCFVGAGSVVTKSVNDFEVVFGNPAKNRGWVSERGVRLDFDCADSVTDAGITYVRENERVIAKKK